MATHLKSDKDVIDEINSQSSKKQKSDSDSTTTTHAAVYPSVIGIVPTFYTNSSDYRFKLAIQTIQLAKKFGVFLLVVDASPNQKITQQLIDAGANLVKETPGKVRGKGNGLRCGIKEAMTRLKDPENSVIIFFEPEKSDILRFYSELSAPIFSDALDVVLPTRSEKSLASLPIEQFHSEKFGNLHIQNLAQEANFLNESFDWLFGPVAFRASFGSFWLQHSGKLWDAQIIPCITAAKKKKARIGKVEIDFIYDHAQREAEEYNSKWSGKREMQLHFILPLLQQAFK